MRYNVHGLVIETDNGNGKIVSSDFHEENDPPELKAALDAIESLILAHACAGVNVESDAYIEGVRTAEIAIFDNIGV